MVPGGHLKKVILRFKCTQATHYRQLAFSYVYSLGVLHFESWVCAMCLQPYEEHFIQT